MSVSHSAGPNAAVCKTGRFDKVHRFSAEIFASFILSVTKKQMTSCRRHDAISRAEARKAWRRFSGASSPGAGASANPCVPCGGKKHLPSCLARPMHAHLSTFYFHLSAGAAGLLAAELQMAFRVPRSHGDVWDGVLKITVPLPWSSQTTKPAPGRPHPWNSGCGIRLRGRGRRRRIPPQFQRH